MVAMVTIPGLSLHALHCADDAGSSKKWILLSQRGGSVHCKDDKIFPCELTAPVSQVIVVGGRCG